MDQAILGCGGGLAVRLAALSGKREPVCETCFRRSHNFALTLSIRASLGNVGLNASWFLSLTDARSKFEAWRHDYIEVRAHSSIDHRTPP